MLADIDLAWSAGEHCVVVGPNGAGKSLLLQLIAGLRSPSSGQVERQSPELRVGIVFQTPDDQIVGSTVERDLAFGLENLGLPTDEMHARVDDMLERLELRDRRRSPPHLLSEGEKQRLALGAALVMNPGVLLLDEPTSRLDPEGRRLFLREVRRVREERGTTVVLVTHRSEEVLPADRAIALESGRVVFDGAPPELLAPEWDPRAGIRWSDLHRLRQQLAAAGVRVAPSTGEGWNDPGELLAGLGIEEHAS
ncbi:MAG: energy-coupling factor transporter ATP-binding protein EcfA [Gemmatimonadota bacterium]|nr:MAG: energy-coupling factor transporter ATP-binding protein EcfA [Gemmatimonadota bacterium]